MSGPGVEGQRKFKPILRRYWLMRRSLLLGDGGLSRLRPFCQLGQFSERAHFGPLPKLS